MTIEARKEQTIKDFLQVFADTELKCKNLVKIFTATIDTYKIYLETDNIGYGTLCCAGLRAIFDAFKKIAIEQVNAVIDDFHNDLVCHADTGIRQIFAACFSRKSIDKHIGIRKALKSDDEGDATSIVKKMQLEHCIGKMILVGFDSTKVQKKITAINGQIDNINGFIHGENLEAFDKTFQCLLNELFEMASMFVSISQTHFEEIDKWLANPQDFGTIWKIIKSDFRKQQYFSKKLTSEAVSHDVIYFRIKELYFDKTIDGACFVTKEDDKVSYPDWPPVFYLRKLACISEVGHTPDTIAFKAIFAQILDYLKKIGERDIPNLLLADFLISILNAPDVSRKITRKDDKIKVINCINVIAGKSYMSHNLIEFVFQCLYAAKLSQPMKAALKPILLTLLKIEAKKTPYTDTYTSWDISSGSYQYADLFRRLEQCNDPAFLFEVYINTFTELLQNLPIADREGFLNSIVNHRMTIPKDKTDVQLYVSDILIDNLRDSGLKALAIDKAKVFSLLSAKVAIEVNGQAVESPIPIFSKLQLYFLLEAEDRVGIYAALKEWASLTTIEMFGNYNFLHDYYYLQEKGLGYLEDEQKDELVSKIFSQIRRAVFKDKLLINDGNKELNEGRKARFLIGKLYPLQSYVSYARGLKRYVNSLLQYFNQRGWDVKADIKAGKHYFDRLTWSTGGGVVITTGTPSLYSIDDVKNLLDGGIDRLLDVIKYYKQTEAETFMYGMHESGLAQNCADVLTTPDFSQYLMPFLEECPGFIKQDKTKAIYLYCILEHVWHAHGFMLKADIVDTLIDMTIEAVDSSENINSTRVARFLERLNNSEVLTSIERYKKVHTLIAVAIKKINFKAPRNTDNWYIGNVVINDAQCLTLTALFKFFRCVMQTGSMASDDIKAEVQKQIKDCFITIVKEKNPLFLYIYGENTPFLWHHMQDWLFANLPQLFDKKSEFFFQSWRGFIERSMPHGDLIAKLSNLYEFSLAQGYSDREFYNERITFHIVQYLIWDAVKAEDAKIINPLFGNLQLSDEFFGHISRLPENIMASHKDLIKALYSQKLALIPDDKTEKKDHLYFECLFDYGDIYGAQWLIEHSIALYKRGCFFLEPYDWSRIFPKLILLLETQPALKEGVIEHIIMPIVSRGTAYRALPDEVVRLIQENQAAKEKVLQIADLDLIARIECI